MHFFPSPSYPALHVHVYEPAVFVQSALTSQLSTSHSSTSVTNRTGMSAFINIITIPLIYLSVRLSTILYVRLSVHCSFNQFPFTLCFFLLQKHGQCVIWVDICTGKKGFEYLYVFLPAIFPYLCIFFHLLRTQSCTCRSMSPRYSCTLLYSDREADRLRTHTHLCLQQ